MRRKIASKEQLSSSKLCVSVGAETLEELARKASRAKALGCDLVEVRVDKLVEQCSPGEIEARLAPFAERAVFTVRSASEGGAFKGSEGQRLELLARLAGLRPAFLDVELSTAKKNPGWMRSSLGDDVKLIISWHDFSGTPPPRLLRSICEEELGMGEIAKAITTARSFEDNLTTLGACREARGRVVSFCMGELGVLSRVLSMRLGAPLAYASIPDESMAPGQLSISMMRTMRGMMMLP